MGNDQSIISDSNQTITLTENQLNQLETWTKLHFDSILFDTDCDLWENSTILNERIVGKKDLVFLIENEDEDDVAIPTEIANTLDVVIEFNPSQDELVELQIREIAPLYDVQLTKATTEVVKETISQNSFKNIKSVLKYISDYLYLHAEIQQPLTAEEMREILKCVS